MTTGQDDELDEILVSLSKKLHDGGINHAEAAALVRSWSDKRCLNDAKEIYNKLIGVAQARRDDTELQWQELYLPLLDYIAALEAQLKPKPIAVSKKRYVKLAREVEKIVDGEPNQDKGGKDVK